MEKLREEFVLAAKGHPNFSALCQAFGISRRTGYKWLVRAQEGGTSPYSDQCKTPHRVANKTPPETERLILDCRQENPAWGGRTIRQALENAGHEHLPCAKTCGNILKRHGLIDPAESLKHKAFCRFEREACNELWQTDFKGDFPLGDGSRCYPLTILDDHSRFSILIEPKPNPQGVKESFRQAFMTYGMPEAVLSDNGAQFAGFKGGYTQFERWLMDNDILPIHGRIHHPQTQGKIERFHRTMKQELLNHTPFADLEDARQQLLCWRTKYNELRPHQALGMQVPAQVYVPSTRYYQDRMKRFAYGGAYPVRKVNNWGYLRFEPVQVYLSETMADTYLEIRPEADGDTFSVCYRNFRIARIDAASRTLVNRTIVRL